MRFRILGIVVAMAAASCASIANRTPSSLSGPFQVRDSKLIDLSTGKPIRLLGAHLEGLAQFTGDPYELARLGTRTFRAMKDQWHMNAVRLALSCWIFAAHGDRYLDQVESIVRLANESGLIVILDLHDGQAYLGSPYPGLELPVEAAVRFWKGIANRFKSNPQVVFDLYNEPTFRKEGGPPTQAEWDLWLNGGEYNGHRIVGMQDLADAVRSVGAKNLILVEGLTLASTFENLGDRRVRDFNVGYSVHPYFSRNLNQAEWLRNFGDLLGKEFLLAGEWGLIPSSRHPLIYSRVASRDAEKAVEDLLDFFDEHDISWTAYTFTRSPQGCLLSDEENFSPTSFQGQWSYGDQNPDIGMGSLVLKRLRHLNP